VALPFLEQQLEHIDFELCPTISHHRQGEFLLRVKKT
jgi:hypothetical protein